MRSLPESAFAGPPDVAAVREVDAALRAEAANDSRKVVPRIGSEGPGAKCDAIRRIVDDFGHTLERYAVGNDPRQTKNRPRRIIRMQRHTHAR